MVSSFHLWSRRGRVVVVIVLVQLPSCAISVYHHKSYEFESRAWRCVLDATRYN